MKPKGVTTQTKVLNEYFQSSPEALATDNFIRLLHFTVLATYCNHTCIIQMVSSQHNKKCLLCYELLNNADFYFCYVLKIGNQGVHESTACV